jgi:hypothetical protein
MTQNNLSDIAQSLDQLNINDHSIRNTIGDLIEVNDLYFEIFISLFFKG